MNNFEQIQSLMKFENDYDFYYIQILRRRKENPGQAVDAITVAEYEIFSKDEFATEFPSIVDICKKENARAYIRLNRRNKQTEKEVKTWLIDIDYDENGNVPKYMDEIFELLVSLQQAEHNDFSMIKIPTKNGFHYIAKTFDLKEFRRLYKTIDVNKEKKIDIHKDGPTVLFCN